MTRRTAMTAAVFALLAALAWAAGERAMAVGRVAGWAGGFWGGWYRAGRGR